MLGLFSDMRKMALAASGLLVLALLFADPGGIGGKAVQAGEHVKEPEGVTATQTAKPRVEPARKEWFAANAGEDEPPQMVIRPPEDASPPQPVFAPGEARQPRPTGPDFPPG